MAARADVEFMLGEHWIIDLTCTDNDLPLNLGGGQVEFAMAQDNTLILNLETPDGVAVMDAAAGEVMVTITPTQQTNLSIRPGFYQYQVRAVTAAGIITDQVYGNITVRQNIFNVFNL